MARLTRGRFVAAALCGTLVPLAASAQPLPPTPRSLDMLKKLVRDPTEIEGLVMEVDVVVAVAALTEARRRSVSPPAGGTLAYQELRAALVRERAAYAGALDATTDSLAQQAAGAAILASAGLRRLLVEGGVRDNGPLLDQLLQGFTTFSQLTSLVRKQDRWWCRCYGLSILC